jgi:nitrite reductase (NADH) large subunit
VQRVGMDYVKKRIVEDAAGRKALHERLKDALCDEKDPWQERVRGAEAREFVPISFYRNNISGDGHERMDKSMPA